jgi:aspartyl-tRNA(Asn)/glutamyl-tRNA(Gln) amidotransferase subunit B
MEYETIIGLEVHVELSTKTKLFCGCTTVFGGESNTQCCPVCVGMPGTLPVVNKKAVEYAIKAGLALNCTISERSKMDRKNYFYPDLPKAYQISQYDYPLCRDGYLDIEINGKHKRIRINRIHLEEDAGKLIHDQRESESLIDYNRCGIPLIEIVTEPDMRSPEEAVAFFEALASVLKYIGVSDCKMEEGSLRCDVNLSVRPVGQKDLGKRTEMKNLNSFRAAYRAMVYESKRQEEILERGGTIIQETRRWDDRQGESFPMRTKEEVQDYRYFPEPDLIPIIIDKDWIQEIKKQIPELPNQKKQRFIEEYRIPEYDAGVLTASQTMADFFEDCVKLYNNPKIVSNWIMGDFSRLLKENHLEIGECLLSPQHLAKMLNLIDDGFISNSAGKIVIEEMFKTGEDPEKIVEEKGLKQISSTEELISIVRSVMRNNLQSVLEYKKGKEKVRGFLVGQIMKATQGKANPQMANRILDQELKKFNPAEK